MLSNTDYDAVNKLLIDFLHLEPIKTPFSPIVIKHPFTNSGHVCIENNGEIGVLDITENTDNFRKWTNFFEENVLGRRSKEECVTTALIYIVPSYYFAFLKFAEKYLCKKDLSMFLKFAWKSCEAPNQDKNISKKDFIRLFKEADKSYLMDEKELETYNSLPDEVTIYRGVTSYNMGSDDALSWTLDKEVAQFFATRFGEENGKIYVGKIRKEHIVTYFTQEKEVIVEPKCIKRIQ